MVLEGQEPDDITDRTTDPGFPASETYSPVNSGYRPTQPGKIGGRVTKREGRFGVSFENVVFG